MEPFENPEQPNPFQGQGVNRRFYLSRLPREYYQGDAVVHWTLPIALRGTGWLSESFHTRFREMMLHTAAREGLFCPTYRLMPGHLHLVWMGLRHDTDQRNGMKFLREYLGPALRPHRFQHLALRDDFWTKFWKLFLTARAPDAGNIQRPPLSSS